MKKKLLFSLLAIALAFSSQAQSLRWTETSPERLKSSPKADRDAMPLAFKLFHVDYDQLKARLSQAPSRNSGVESTVTVQFPNPAGQLETFRVYEASVMHPELAARYQEIQSYVGQNVNKPSETIRLTTTVFGLHVMASTEKGTHYIDPYTKDLSNYIVYEKAKLQTTRSRQCLVEDSPEHSTGLRANAETQLAGDSKFRTYRLAMACTIEYATFHWQAAGIAAVQPVATKKAAVLAAMNVTVARLNQVYEKDMSLTFQLVPNNDVIIFITSDSFANDDANTLINQSQTVIDANIGSANYDIGHTVSTGGGGLAQRPSVCVVGKARGITGSPAPVGDPYDIDFVAHEVGHQFGANHTFNGVTAASEGNCTTGTRAPGAAVEPGSGSTIMAYAGICGVMDVQSNSDDHFHAISIAEMMGHITGAGNCVAGVNNNNTPPVADAGINYTIPRGTPFVLKGSATDANNDTLTYCWEQTNNEISTQPPLNTNTTGPNFRSNPPSTSPNRYMPSLATVISNLPSKWEVLPNVGRTMNFALTVRDNRTPNGGQTSRDDMQVTTVAAAGPFVVTSQNAEQQVLVPGSTQTVTWDVAGTTGNGVNTANVRILFSTDNGVTFPIVLSESTANDGSHEVTLPNVTAPYCRIMVEAVGNIFFNVNSKNIALGNYTYQMQNVCEDYFFNAGIQIPESANQYTGYSLNIPDNFTLSDVNINPVITHPNMGNIYLGVRHPSMTTGVTRLASASCAGSANLDLVYDSQGAAVNCANTTSGAATLPLDTLNAYNGLSSQGSWVFFLVDAVVGDNVRGTWESITLNLCRLELVPTLAVENFGLDQFVVYPNPNNGEFNVKFNSSSTTKIEITLHDIQGRSIFNQSFENTGVFDQKLKLDNVQSGIYIVTVQDGPIKEVRRIVVE